MLIREVRRDGRGDGRIIGRKEVKALMRKEEIEGEEKRKRSGHV